MVLHRFGQIVIISAINETTYSVKEVFMFRKFLIVAMFATAAGYCFAAESLPQVVTSEVF